MTTLPQSMTHQMVAIAAAFGPAGSRADSGVVDAAPTDVDAIPSRTAATMRAGQRDSEAPR